MWTLRIFTLLNLSTSDMLNERRSQKIADVVYYATNRASSCKCASLPNSAKTDGRHRRFRKATSPTIQKVSWAGEVSSTENDLIGTYAAVRLSRWRGVRIRNLSVPVLSTLAQVCALCDEAYTPTCHHKTSKSNLIRPCRCEMRGNWSRKIRMNYQMASWN